MKALFSLAIGILWAGAFLPYATADDSADAASEAGFVSIFNGQDFAGWDGKPGAWEIRDGEIW